MPILPTRLAVPLEQAVYTGLHTDHYPWTEVTLDLATRQAQGLSAVFDAQQGPNWARFVWVQGTLQGGFTPAGDLTWSAAMAALPRAQVTLVALNPAVAELVWRSRMQAPQPLEGAWPQPQADLTRQRFSGVLLGEQACSFWVGGERIAGTLPSPGAACSVLASAVPLAPGPEALLAFWTELIATVHRAAPLDEAWRGVSMRLAEQHPCLDPFAREVSVQNGQLHVDPDVPPTEVQPALLDAFRATLARLGQRLADLPLAELRARPEWRAAGLERA
ncbi:hypothetical protein [Deinococcus sp. YIM 77859]|uniref:hypothetical protein n=1 Tax=Deinococcus sp. YIM 77859 TaxID=1540221 RepID=UPI000551DE5D|nr:hypothetical protein [Deinococcus sp. YIM 77859]